MKVAWHPCVRPEVYIYLMYNARESGKKSYLLLRILCVHIETSSLGDVYINKNKCFSVSLVSEEDKRI